MKGKVMNQKARKTESPPSERFRSVSAKIALPVSDKSDVTKKEDGVQLTGTLASTVSWRRGNL
jgi:hypothetical protein